MEVSANSVISKAHRFSAMKKILFPNMEEKAQFFLWVEVWKICV